MPTVTVYVIAYILGFSHPDGVREVQLGDDLIIWNVSDSRAPDWAPKQHFAKLGYKVEAGQNSVAKAYLELEQALLPVRLYSSGDLQPFLPNPGRVNPNPMSDNERSSFPVSPSFPGAIGGRVKGYG